MLSLFRRPSKTVLLTEKAQFSNKPDEARSLKEAQKLCFVVVKLILSPRAQFSKSPNPKLGDDREVLACSSSTT